jgi:hypothetical protein
MRAAELADREVDRTIEHMVGAIAAGKECREPFHHLELGGVFPADLYAEMLDAMPEKHDYRRMSGRTRYTRTADGGTRTKIDLFPEYLRHLPSEKRRVWKIVGRVLRADRVREAFRARLAPNLERRFGAGYRDVGMYPLPILTRDVAGYSIGVHPDTRWKGMTVQLYLPRDRSIEHVGTVFHRAHGPDGYPKAKQMAFAPNTGYAFGVGADTFHSVDPLGAEVATRDSILLTYFVDQSPLHVVRNRSRRFGNFILNEIRSFGR